MEAAEVAGLDEDNQRLFDQVVAAGYTGVIVYVSELRPGATFDFKPVSRGYTDALRAAGLQVVDVIEPEWPEGFTQEWGQWSPLRGAIFPGTAIFVCVKPH